MNIVITALKVAGLCYLTFGMNHISENLMSISFENHKNWSKYNIALGGVI